MSKRIAVMGCGALGGYAGGYLTRAGLDVTMIDPWPEHVAAMRDPGLRLEGLTEPECFRVKTNAVLLDDLPAANAMPPFDIIFIAVKSFDTPAAAERMAPYLAADGVAVSLQNGINEELIADAMGAARTVGCIASQIAVALPGPGHIRRLVKLGGDAHTVFRVGEIDGSKTPRVEEIVQMLAKIDSARVTDNLMGERWSKLAANCMRNPVSAATGLGTNDNDRDPHLRAVAIGLAAEAIRVARAEGVQLVNVFGIAPDLLDAAGSGNADAIAQVTDKFSAAMERRSDDQRPSMAQDVAKGRKTEIDHINGLVAQRGRRHGVPTPLNDAICDVVRGIDDGKITPGPETLRALAP